MSHPSRGICSSESLDTKPAHPILPSMTGTCPVVHESSTTSISSVGDEFPDSTPQPDQRIPLSTAAIPSHIPRGGADQPEGAVWVFPSPQRFMNAMVKKGWSPSPEQMSSIVSIHNTVNHRTWQHVMQYESFHTCPNPKLLRFRGRPADISPKARILGWMGYVAPFDRHDWYVDRCGKEVRYIIDFYQGPEVFGMPAAIHLDVRPEVSFGGLIDRARMAYRSWLYPDQTRIPHIPAMEVTSGATESARRAAEVALAASKAANANATTSSSTSPSPSSSSSSSADASACPHMGASRS